MGPLFAIIGALAGGLFVYRNKTRSYRSVYILGGSLVASSLFGLLFGPLFRPPVLGVPKTTNGRTVVANLYDSFMHVFNTQIIAVLYIIVAILLATFVFQHFKKIKSVFVK